MRKRTILVVNDELGIQDWWAQILSEEGFRVLRAGNPGEALKRLAYRPTVAICKVRSPDPGSLWLAETIRDQCRATALVLFDEEREPQDRDELLATVRRAIGWNSQLAPAAH
jgi:CheY-like chemotaxis protein